MILHWIKGIFYICKGILAKPIDPPMPGETSFRVSPFECDDLRFMRNTSFVNNMEYARWHYAARCGLVKKSLQKTWYFIIGSQFISYKKPLRIFSRYSIKSEIIYWDDKWFYMSQIFKQWQEIIATGIVKLIITDRNGKVHPGTVCTEIGMSPQPKQKLEFLQTFAQFEKENLQFTLSK